MIGFIVGAIFTMSFWGAYTIFTMRLDDLNTFEILFGGIPTWVYLMYLVFSSPYHYVKLRKRQGKEISVKDYFSLLFNKGDWGK